MSVEMASNNTSLGAALDISKLKVQDLKKELKLRGLNTTGNKNELVERLQTALKSNESVDDLEEDLLNVDDDLDTTDSVINNIDAALDESLNPKPSPTKRKLCQSNDEITENKPPPTKKVVLNRNPSTILDTRISTESKESDSVHENGVKKVIKLSEISVKERLEMRATKFGVPLSTEARKVARAERFGTTKATTNTIKNNVPTSVDVLKQRAERFGGSVSKVLTKLDYKERLEKRKQRFGALTNTTSSPTSTINKTKSLSDDEQKKQQRLMRFKQTVK